MTTAEQKKNLQQFVKAWKSVGNEKQHTQQFWFQLLTAIGYKNINTVLFEHRVSNGGFIDVWIRDVDVMVEMKSLNIDLDKPELRQGIMKTPLQQVLDYAEDVPRSEQPRYLLTCNFDTFRVYDRDNCGKSALKDNAFEFSLEELGQHPEYLSFITDPSNTRLEKEKTVSIKAGERIGQLYDLLREGYIDPDSEENMHALNVLCVRLVFCLYCEDADLFEKDSFLHYLQGTAPEDVRPKLKNLFRALDTERPERDPYDTNIRVFPYVNGGLFKEDVEIPNFSQEALDFLLEEVSAPIDWSQISPTIFGGIFESTLNPETRRTGGMHYTSPENIHKVIDPLFLDDLWNELNSIRDDENLTPRQKDNRYKKLHQKICNLTFFDPACGSGNFLTETYLCLRKLEDQILSEIRVKAFKKSDNSYEYMPGQIELTTVGAEDTGERISLTQFHGIEINDFAVSVAETALYISRLKANADTMMLLDVDSGDLPLKESAHIVHENALRTNWNDVVPAEECDYIMGNPPFFGGMQMSKEQKEEMRYVFHFLKGVGELDYVSAWYVKAAEYIREFPIYCAFVSTNSICQGLPVGIFWKYMKESLQCEINYAYRTFIWNNEASHQAHVHVVIVGFSKLQYQHKRKTLYLQNGQKIQCAHINGYLMANEDNYITEIAEPLSPVPHIRFGSMPRAKGFTLSAEQREQFIKENPISEKWIHPYWGAEEFLNRKERYCLWLVDATISEINECPLVLERVKQVRNERKSSKAAGTRKFAKTPTLFAQIAQPVGEGHYLLIPRVSSERRDYIPIAFVDNTVIASDLAYLVPSANLYHFGVLSSQFHNAWIRMVAGRLKSDYRYAKDLVYNTFVWPKPTDQQIEQIQAAAQNVLNVRDSYEDQKIGDIYKREKMPEDLLAAHKALDEAVEESYGVNYAGDEEKIVTHLFKLYQQMVDDKQAAQTKKTPITQDAKKATVKVRVRKQK